MESAGRERTPPNQRTKSDVANNGNNVKCIVYRFCVHTVHRAVGIWDISGNIIE